MSYNFSVSDSQRDVHVFQTRVVRVDSGTSSYQCTVIHKSTHIHTLRDTRTHMHLDSMHWFSHQRSHAREDQSRQNCTQAANVRCRHPITAGRPHNGLACCYMQHTACSARTALPWIVNGNGSAVIRFLSLMTLTFDLDIRTRARFLWCT